MSMDSKRLRNFRQHASGVSRALWPANMRRSLATGRVAQRRRSLVINRRWGVLPATILHLGSSLSLMLISVVVGGSIVIALVLRLWYVLIIPATILTIMTLLVLPLFLLRPSHTFNTSALQPSRETRGLAHHPNIRRSPETPLPATPLVRVLETYDLSENEDLSN